MNVIVYQNINFLEQMMEKPKLPKEWILGNY